MDTGLGSWVAHHADGFARAFARAGIGLGTLATHRQTAQMAHPAVALNALKTLEVHTNFTPQVAFNHVFAILNGVHDLGKLLFGQVFGANAGIDIRPGQNVFGIAGTDAVDIPQGDIDTLVWRNFDADDTSHKIRIGLALTLFVPRVRADHANDAFATNNFAIFAKLLN